MNSYDDQFFMDKANLSRQWENKKRGKRRVRKNIPSAEYKLQEPVSDSPISGEQHLELIERYGRLNAQKIIDLMKDHSSLNLLEAELAFIEISEMEDEATQEWIQSMETECDVCGMPNIICECHPCPECGGKLPPFVQSHSDCNKVRYQRDLESKMLDTCEGCNLPRYTCMCCDVCGQYPCMSGCPESEEGKAILQYADALYWTRHLCHDDSKFWEVFQTVHSEITGIKDHFNK